jgi:hypothetical protein
MEGAKKCVQDFGWKTSSEETSRKIRAYMEGKNKMNLKEIGFGVWIGFVSLRIGMSSIP